MKNFLARRARVRDDSGRSLHFELDLERSFGGTLSRQSVCEQTSGVLRHTESVQDDKVQKQDWKQSLEKIVLRTARPRSCSRSRRQQGPRGPQRSKGRRVVNQKCVPEGRGSARRDGLFLSTRRRRGAKPLAVAEAAFEKTLRRLCSRLLRQRQDFEWSNSLQRCCGRPLCFLNGHQADTVAPNGSVARTIVAGQAIIGTESQKSVRHIFSEHLDVVCAQQRPRLRGGHKYSQRHFQYRYSSPDCKVQIHLLRPCKQAQPQAQTARTQRGQHRREG